MENKNAETDKQLEKRFINNSWNWNRLW